MALVKTTLTAGMDFGIDLKCALCGERPSVVHWHGFLRGVERSDLALCVGCAESMCVGLLADLVMSRSRSFAALTEDLRTTVVDTVRLRVRHGTGEPWYPDILQEIDGE